MGKINTKLTGILLLALVLRLIAINQSLWLDEAIGALAVKNFSYSEILTTFISVDNHTPLYYSTLKFWTNITGFSENGLRSLSILFGLLTIIFTFQITKKLAKNKSTKYLASLLMSISQFHIYYSQEARMYSMAAFFATLSILYYYQILKKPNTKKLLIFGVSIALLIATDYMPIFLLPVFFIYAILNKNNKIWWKNFLLSFSPLIFFAALWLPTFTVQLENYSGISRSFLFGGASIKQAILIWTKFVSGRISFEPKAAYYALIAATSVPILLSLQKSLTKKNSLIWLWLITPLVLSFTVSLFLPAFAYFRFLYIYPAFTILISLGFEKIKPKNLSKVILISIITLNLVSLSAYYTDKNQQREEWRQAVSHIESMPKANAIAIFEFPEPFAPYEWYENGIIQSAGATNSISASETETTNKTNSLIKDKTTIYHFEYLKDVSDPNNYVIKAISSQGFSETAKTSEFIGVGAITTYEK